MIDIESQLYAELKEVLTTTFPGIRLSGDYVNEPTKFPYVSFVEADNYVPARYQDTSNREKYAELMYEVNIYSNKTMGKKDECRKILSVLDEWMYSRNFRRYSMNPVPNLENSTIYRLTARYRAVTDGETIYRR